MNNVYGVIFKDNGKEYYFNGQKMDLNPKDNVIVETEKGLQYGEITNLINSKKIDNSISLKNIIRKATEKDYEQYLSNTKEAKLALKKATNISKKLNLSMTFINSSFTFDRNQLLLNFYADERVDFRELAKKLAAIYKTRIELRQLGARDRAANCDGVGVCGRQLCCSSFLNNMESVSMNMAKNQNLSLNPSKINGCCGRLLCCLTYEDDEYIRCQKNLPHVGETIDTEYGKGTVKSVNILLQKYKVEIDGQIFEITKNDKMENQK